MEIGQQASFQFKISHKITGYQGNKRFHWRFRYENRLITMEHVASVKTDHNQMWEAVTSCNNCKQIKMWTKMLQNHKTGPHNPSVSLVNNYKKTLSFASFNAIYGANSFFFWTRHITNYMLPESECQQLQKCASSVCHAMINWSVIF